MQNAKATNQKGKFMKRWLIYFQNAKVWYSVDGRSCIHIIKITQAAENQKDVQYGGTELRFRLTLKQTSNWSSKQSILRSFIVHEQCSPTVAKTKGENSNKLPSDGLCSSAIVAQTVCALLAHFDYFLRRHLNVRVESGEAKKKKKKQTNKK